MAIIGQDGAELGQITGTDVIDPFETYNPAYPPERGYRMVLVTITLDGTGAQPFSFNPSSLGLVDDGGFIATGIFTEVPAEAGVTILEAQDIAPGATVSGSLAFQVFTGANVNAVMYWPESDRAIPLARPGTALPAVGDAVPVLANDGSDSAHFTINEIQDPFEGYDPSSSPQRGNHLVLITVTFENTGVRPTRVDPNAFALLDSDGFLTSPSFVSRGEDPLLDLVYTDPFAPGETVTGAIAFEVLSGTTLTSVVYTPSSDQFVEVGADGTAGGSGTTAAATPVGAQTDTPAATDDAADTDVCAGIDEWSAATVERFTTAGGFVGGIQPLEDKIAADAPAVRQAAADIAALAAEQESSPTPGAAVEFNSLAVLYLTDISQSLDFFAEGLENGDVTKQVVALANLGIAEESFASGGPAQLAYEVLLATCAAE
ncbi:hypothetical protein BH23CHL4_BH23CHL4_22710 [soil metagenome]